MKLSQNVRLYLKNVYLANQYITDYDRARVKQINLEYSIIGDLLNLMLKLCVKFKGSYSNDAFKFYIDSIIRNCIVKIRQYAEEPLSFFPDVSLWLLFNNKPVGICNIRSSDVIWSEVQSERGEICGQMVYMDVKVIIQHLSI